MKKVALLFVCINPMYWPYMKDIVQDARKHFLTTHQVDFFAWSDMPVVGSPEMEGVLQQFQPQAELPNVLMNLMSEKFNKELAVASTVPLQQGKFIEAVNDSFSAVGKMNTREQLKECIEFLRSEIPAERLLETHPVDWPLATLMRYHLFLQQEEALKEYDYIFYCDVDMRMVDTITDEILGDGLTAALHPMYAFRPGLRFPLEPNPVSAAYIKVPQYYYAGGFQGGKAKDFLEAMKGMKKTIDYDYARNYTAIWNDESHWNKYLSEHPPAVVCSPSYIYPDSLIDNYYKPLWGAAYPPKIITLTKRFGTTKEAGANVAAVTADLSKLQS